MTSCCCHQGGSCCSKPVIPTENLANEALFPFPSSSYRQSYPAAGIQQCSLPTGQCCPTTCTRQHQRGLSYSVWYVPEFIRSGPMARVIERHLALHIQIRQYLLPTISVGMSGLTASSIYTPEYKKERSS